MDGYEEAMKYGNGAKYAEEMGFSSDELSCWMAHSDMLKWARDNGFGHKTCLDHEVKKALRENLDEQEAPPEVNNKSNSTESRVFPLSVARPSVSRTM